MSGLLQQFPGCHLSFSEHECIRAVSPEDCWVFDSCYYEVVEPQASFEMCCLLALHRSSSHVLDCNAGAGDRIESATDDDTTGGRSMGTTRTVNEATGEVIDQERFTKTVDHQVVVERTTWLLEHRPIQKKYVMETRLVGERGVEGKPTEIIGPVQSRIVRLHRLPALLFGSAS